MFVERDGRWLKWKWSEYYNDARNFAKALMALQVSERAATNIIGFNSPEWFIAFTGSIFANNVPAGVYTTNGPQSCLYVAEHSDAEVIVCEDASQLKKYEEILDKLGKVKAFVIWAGDLPPHRRDDSRFFTWKAFLRKGSALKEDVGFNVAERMDLQKPGMCCDLIYTSGTTGPPKGVMLSHDNLVWSSHVNFFMLAQHGDIG